MAGWLAGGAMLGRVGGGWGRATDDFGALRALTGSDSGSAGSSWAVGRRYLSESSMAELTRPHDTDDPYESLGVIRRYDPLVESSHLRFVVTGTGRSGTGYASKLFTAAGLPCGHEDYFDVWPAIGEVGVQRDMPMMLIRRPYHRVRESQRRRRLAIVGDASWMAVPRLVRFKGLSMLQLRHPAKVVRSFLATGFFTDMSTHRRQRGYALRYFGLTGDPIEDALRWWVEWNRRAAQHCDIVFALESLSPELLAGILHRLGVKEPHERSEAAFAAVPRDVNSSEHRGLSRSRLEWADIPETHVKHLVAEQAASWGYDPSDEGVLPALPAGV